ncbi:MAG TPA: type II toxin-antitoxin system VapC family toxin [Marmoricola sp.]
MTQLLVDTSVLIKWFHSEREREVTQARAIRDAHVRGDVDAHVLDLAVYEMGNVLSRALQWSASDVAEQLDDLLLIVGPPLAMAQPWLRTAADLAAAHGLTFYDASWAAAASELGVPLVSADRQLISAGLAVSPTAFAAGLTP